MDPMLYPSDEATQKLRKIASRLLDFNSEQEQQVKDILKEVKQKGDEALLEFTRRFDSKEFTIDNLTVSSQEMEEARRKVDDDFLSILNRAISNITRFHENQRVKSWFQTMEDGTILGQVVRPVASAGLYIPGGRGGETPLISSVLMNAIPAHIAGVQDIVMISPPRMDSSLNPYLLVAAAEVGITRIHKLGSAWGIAALAFGTESVSPVDVIVGPGNIFVALAKKLVSGQVGIDMLAGPSEILVIADNTGIPEHLAADLLSQAEHDPLASSVLITTENDLAQKVSREVEKQVLKLPRKDIIKDSWQNYGAIFLVKNLEEAVTLANQLAPEHLEIMTADPFALLGKINNAGAIFLGQYSPEPIGDYFAGPNHVLPTSGTARFSSALGVENFIKKSSVVYYSREAFERDAKSIADLARLESLDAHAAAIEVRMLI